MRRSFENRTACHITVMYSGVMGCGNLGFPEFANLEPIGGKLADYRVYTPRDGLACPEMVFLDDFGCT